MSGTYLPICSKYLFSFYPLIIWILFAYLFMRREVRFRFLFVVIRQSVLTYLIFEFYVKIEKILLHALTDESLA